MPRRKGYRDAGRVEFLALLPELERAFAQGRSVLGFYRDNKARLTISYPQFCRYVQAYDVRPKIRSVVLKPSPATSSPPLPSAKEPLVVQGAELPTFHYDPMDAYRKKFV